MATLWQRYQAILKGDPLPASEGEGGSEGRPEPPDYRRLYKEMSEGIPDSFAAIVDWLVDHHPDRWQAIRDADDHLTALEQGQCTEQEYRRALDHLVALFQEAKMLYAQEKGGGCE